jgi:hypothetical protein
MAVYFKSNLYFILLSQILNLVNFQLFFQLNYYFLDCFNYKEVKYYDFLEFYLVKNYYLKFRDLYQCHFDHNLYIN